MCSWKCASPGYALSRVVSSSAHEGYAALVLYGSTQAILVRRAASYIISSAHLRVVELAGPHVERRARAVARRVGREQHLKSEREREARVR